VEVNLGTPSLLEKDLEISDLRGSLVDVGNLHFVRFWDDLSSEPHLLYGPRIEREAGLERGVNSEHVKVLSRGEIDILVWENGCGATFACGTGAVASVFVGIGRNLLDPGVKVNMPGGSVSIKRSDNGEFLLAGTVESVFKGSYRWKT
jgi:diaminopimelate epimerase